MLRTAPPPLCVAALMLKLAHLVEVIPQRRSQRYFAAASVAHCARLVSGASARRIAQIVAARASKEEASGQVGVQTLLRNSK